MCFPRFCPDPLPAPDVNASGGNSTVTHKFYGQSFHSPVDAVIVWLHVFPNSCIYGSQQWLQFSSNICKRRISDYTVK